MAEPAASSPTDTEIAFDDTGLEQVVADPLRFKQQLRIGEDAFTLLRAKKQLYALYETAGAAGTGAAIAGSSTVAGTFFAPTGLTAMLGLATAATRWGGSSLRLWLQAVDITEPPAGFPAKPEHLSTRYPNTSIHQLMYWARR